MGLLARAGAELSPRAEDADVIVVNTCSFIESAQQESVNTILEMAGHKTAGRAKKLVVAGCLVERFRDEIRKRIPEVDAVVGTGELQNILAATGIAPAPVKNDSPFVVLCLRGPKAMRGRRRGDSLAGNGMARLPTCPTTCTTKRRRAFWRLRSHGLHQDRGGMRPSLHVLHHSAAARAVSLAPLRVGRGRGRAAGADAACAKSL